MVPAKRGRYGSSLFSVGSFQLLTTSNYPHKAAEKRRFECDTLQRDSNRAFCGQWNTKNTRERRNQRPSSGKNL